jgi:hypothetical protein
MERTLKEMDARPPKHADDSTDFIKKLVTHFNSSNENKALVSELFPTYEYFKTVVFRFVICQYNFIDQS